MILNEEQIERYSRHIILEGVGGIGQEKIVQSKILIIGVGGLGSPIALYLSASGVGTLGIADGDVVNLTDLQRQIIHFTSDVGKSKIDSAEEKINKINPDVKVVTYKDTITSDNILEIIKEYDFVVDATDNFSSKFLINDACVLSKKPYSHGGVLKFSGQTMTIIPHKTACYRCLFFEPPPLNTVPNSSQVGVFGILPGILGTIQASEVLKYILGLKELIVNRLLTLDTLSMKFREIEVRKDPNCPVCGKNIDIF